MSERQKKDRKIDRAPGRQRQNDSDRVSGQLKSPLLVLEKKGVMALAKERAPVFGKNGVMAFYIK